MFAKIASSTLCCLFFVSCVFSVVQSSETAPSDTNAVASEEMIIDLAHIDQKLLEALTEEERQWYAKFQDGIMFFDGWKEISEEILTSMPAADQLDCKNLLKTLGIKIGTEWSKDNTVRKINTDQLHSWGSILRDARKKGTEKIMQAILAISDEVDLILAAQSPKVVSDQ